LKPCCTLNQLRSFNTNFTSNAAEMHGGVASLVDGRLELEGGYLTMNIAGGLHPVAHLLGKAAVQYKGVYSDMNNGNSQLFHSCITFNENAADKSLPDSSSGVILDSRRRSGNAGK
jgi:hypothetical protein